MEQTESMAVGSAVGQLLLERAPEEEPIREYEGDTGRRSKGFKAARQAAEDAGALLLTSEELARAEAIAMSVEAGETKAAQVAFDLIHDAGAVHEWAYRWEEDGLPLRVKLDVVLERPMGLVAVELKTTMDPSPEGFGRQMAAYGYHVQGALYVRGLAHAAGVDVTEVTFLHIAIRNTPPFETAVYDNSTHILGVGMEHLDDTLSKLRACISNGGPFAAPWEQPEGPLPAAVLPGWIFYQGGRE
jgi:hypothetical protein